MTLDSVLKHLINTASLITVAVILSTSCVTNAQSHPMSEIMLYKGTPALFIDGEPNAGFCYMTYNF